MPVQPPTGPDVTDVFNVGITLESVDHDGADAAPDGDERGVEQAEGGRATKVGWQEELAAQVVAQQRVEAQLLGDKVGLIWKKESIFFSNLVIRKYL